MLDSALAGIGRVIGKPPGWERVVRAFAPPQRFAHGAVVDVQRDGYMFPVDRGTIIGWSVHFFGTYEPEVRSEIRRHLRPGDVALDVGANVGWHSLLMAASVGSSGHVYAFEPNPTTRERLAKAAAINRVASIHVEACALSDCRGRAAFDAPPAGDVWDGTGKLQGQAGQAGAVVECLTLDAFVEERSIRRIALIKIDVEGWELAVLRGGRNVLETMRPVVIFEFDSAYISRCGGSAGDLARLLANARYTLFALHPRRPPAAIAEFGASSGNFLAIPHEGV